MRTGTRVTALSSSESTVRIVAGGEEIEADLAVNCGGLQSDRLARLDGVDPGLRIVPFRGDYHRLVPSRAGLVKNLIYPVPDPRFPFLGVHFTRMIGGGAEAGPNAVPALAREGYTKTSFDLRDAWESFTYPGFWRLAAAAHGHGSRRDLPRLQQAGVREGPAAPHARPPRGGPRDRRIAACGRRRCVPTGSSRTISGS